MKGGGNMGDDKKQGASEYFSSIDTKGLFRTPDRFALMNRLILRDVNKYYGYRSQAFRRYPKEKIAEFLKHPEKYYLQLREAVIYIYHASSHFRRLIQYFVGLTDLAYVVAPYKLNPKKYQASTVENNYRKVLDIMEAFSVRSQFPKILTVILREDVYYGTMWVTDSAITIQQLPTQYCYISSIEENVFNVSFDFMYFDSRRDELDRFPPEFKKRWEAYRKNKDHRWQELDSPTSFALKCNADLPEYPIPPFSGVLRDIYDLEDYRDLKLAKTALENYAMVVMTLGIDSNGDWQMDLNKAKEFWRNLDHVLPDEIGSVLSPMPINKISFEKTNTGDKDTVKEAEQNMYSSAGVSALLFNNDKASANALLLSIKSDQMITYGIVRSIEAMINRYIHSLPCGRMFKVNFLDCSPYNRKEIGDMYLKACQYGVPMVAYYCASQGLSQAEMEGMAYLENDILGLKDKLIPLQSSNTQSSDASTASNNGAGAPEKDVTELTEGGEVTRNKQ